MTLERESRSAGAPADNRARYFDPDLETLSRHELGAYQLRRFQALLEEVLPANRFYAAKLAGARPPATWEQFRALPFTSKQEIADDQAATPLFGTNLTYAPDRYIRLHQTSGTSGKAPIRWLDTDESWSWWARCWGHVYRAAGVGAGDRVFFAFSFGPFIGFWSAFEGARVVGALAVPGGGMTTEQRVTAMVDVGATVLCSTPTYALRLAETAEQMGVDLRALPVHATIHAGEPGASVPQIRDRIEQAWGARCFDHTGMTEMGATGFTCHEHSGVHLIESEFIAEVIEPSTGRVLEPGERGELVLTNLGRAGMPLIRYRTGDLVELDVEPCQCGRTFARLAGGILGRADDMLVVRGMNVFPSAIEGVVREFPAVAEFRLQVWRERGMDELRLLVEPTEAASADEGEALVDALADLLHTRLLLRVPCSLVAPGTLPRFDLKARRVERLEQPPAPA